MKTPADVWDPVGFINDVALFIWINEIEIPQNLHEVTQWLLVRSDSYQRLKK